MMPPDESTAAAGKEKISPGLPLDYDTAALIMENSRLRDGLNRQGLFIEALETGQEAIRLKAWSSKEDMQKAESILYDCLRSVLLPKKP